MGIRSLLVVLMGLALVSLTAGCAGPSATATPQATPTPPGPTATPTPAPRTINGRISYSGAALANHKILIVANRQGGSGSPGYSTALSSLGPYTIAEVNDATYTLMAFIDLGDDMGPPQPNEPVGWYDVGGDGTPDPVVVSGGKAATGIDITIRDPKP